MYQAPGSSIWIAQSQHDPNAWNPPEVLGGDAAFPRPSITSIQKILQNRSNPIKI